MDKKIIFSVLIFILVASTFSYVVLTEPFNTRDAKVKTVTYNEELEEQGINAEVNQSHIRFSNENIDTSLKHIDFFLPEDLKNELKLVTPCDTNLMVCQGENNYFHILNDWTNEYGDRFYIETDYLFDYESEVYNPNNNIPEGFGYKRINKEIRINYSNDNSGLGELLNSNIDLGNGLEINISLESNYTNLIIRYEYINNGEIVGSFEDSYEGANEISKDINTVIYSNSETGNNINATIQKEVDGKYKIRPNELTVDTSQPNYKINATDLGEPTNNKTNTSRYKFEYTSNSKIWYSYERNKYYVGSPGKNGEVLNFNDLYESSINKSDPNRSLKYNPDIEYKVYRTSKVKEVVVNETTGEKVNKTFYTYHLDIYFNSNKYIDPTIGTGYLQESKFKEGVFDKTHTEANFPTVKSYGAVGYWQLNDGSGITTASDDSQFGNDGTFNDATRNREGPWVSGKSDNSLDFDGDNDYVDVGDNTYGITQKFTLAAWVKTSDSGNVQSVVGIDDTSSPYNRILQFRLDTDGAVRFIRYDSGNNLLANFDTTETVNDGSWHFITATFDNSIGSKIYIDGTEKVNDSNTTNNNDGGEKTLIGARSSQDVGEFFNGTIDEVQIYNCSLNSTEINKLYNNPGYVASCPAGGGGGTNTVKLDGSDVLADVRLEDGTCFNSQMKWDIASIPSDANINQGKVCLWINSVSCLGEGCPDKDINNTYINNQTWNESTNASYFNSTYMTLENETAASMTSNVTNTWTCWNVTEQIKESHGNNNKNFTFRFEDPDKSPGTITGVSDGLAIGCMSDTGMFFNDSEDGGGTPYLNVTYTTTGAAGGGTVVGDWKLNESGSDTTAKDSSGKGNDGSLNNFEFGPVWNDSCVFGGCYDFDGDDDYVDAGSDASLNLDDSDFTISAWINWGGSTGNIQTIASKKRDVAGYDKGWGLTILSSDTLRFYSSEGTDKKTVGSFDFTGNENKWYHIVAIYNSTAISTYVDGGLDDSTSFPEDAYADSSYNTFIGKEGLNRRYFNGKIDHVQIYDYALSSEEIMHNYKQGNDSLNGNSYEKPYPYFLSNYSTGYYYSDIFNLNYTAEFSQVNYTYYETPADSVLYMPFENSTEDVSKYGNDGSKGGFDGDELATGKVGEAYDFDGSDDYVGIPDSESGDLDINDEITLTAWIKLSQDYDTGTIIDKENSGYQGYQFNHHKGGNSKLGFIVGGSADQLLFSSSNITDDSWHHVAVSFSSSTDEVKFYIDGSNDVTRSAPGGTLDSTSYPVQIGRRGRLNNEFFNGTIDEVQIYDRALNSTEIENLYNRTKKGRFMHTDLNNQENGVNLTLSARSKDYSFNDTGLVGWWELDKDSNARLNGNVSDLSGQDNEGSIELNGSALTFEDGKVDEGMVFDGSDDYVEVADDASLRFDHFTLASWFKTRGSTGDNQAIVNKEENYFMRLTSNLQLGGGFYNGTGWFQPKSSALTPDKWYYGVVRYNGSEVALYVNGSKVVNETTSGSPETSSINLKIGTWANNFFNGTIDSVMIWNRSLSASEISDLYNSGNPSGGQNKNWSSWSEATNVNDVNETTTADLNVDGGRLLQLKSQFSGNDEQSSFLQSISVEYEEDTTPPTFTTIPADDTITYGTDWSGVDFNSNEDVIWSVNDTINFNINSTGYLDDNNAIAGGIYKINVTIKDAGDNRNSTIYTLTVNKAIPVMTVENNYGSINTSGMVGYWNMNNNTNDLSGHSNDGTKSGFDGDELVSGKVGEAYDFDGSDDYVEAGSTFNNFSDFTWSAWAKLEETGSSCNVIITSEGPAQDGAFILYHGAWDRWKAYGAGGDISILSSIDPNQNEWYFLTLTRKNGNVTFWVNGVDEGTDTYAADLKTGNSYKIGTGGFNGSIDEVQIYDRALNSTEIEMLYKTQVTHPTETNVSVSNNAGITNNLYRNSSSVSNPDVSTLSVNEYDYIANSSGNENYTEIGTYSILDVVERPSVGLKNGTASDFIINSSSLSGYWDFEGDLVDESFYTNNGTGIGLDGDELVDSITGQGYNLSQSEYIEIPDDNSLDFNDNNLSFGGWFYSQDASDSNQMLLSKRSNEGYMSKLDSNKIYLYLEDSDGDSLGWAGSNTNIESNKYYHFMYVIDQDNEEVKLYINGEFDRQWSISNIEDLSSSTTLDIGDQFTGIVDEFQVFRKALSSKNINMMINNREYPVTTSYLASSSTSSYSFYRNGTEVSSPDINDFDTGHYYYTVNTTTEKGVDVKSYSLLTINKADSVIYTYINGSRNNITVQKGDSIWINSSLETGELGNISLNVDGSQVAFSSSSKNISNYYTFDTIGTYTINSHYSGNKNYNSSDENWTVTVEDAQPPEFTNIPPNASLEYKIDSLNVDFDANDESGISSWWIDNSDFTIDSSGRLKNDTVLDKGVYNINISVNDTKGNTNSMIYKVTVEDTINPVLTIVSPESKTYTVDDIDFNVSIQDKSNISWCGYSINSENISMNEINSTYFSHENDSVNDGHYNVVYTCNDTSGNYVSESREFAVDTIPPIISLNQPTTHDYYDYNEINFNFSAWADGSNISSCQLYGDWGGWSVKESWYIGDTNVTGNSTNITLSEGTYKWNVWCNDSASLGDWSQQGNQTFSIDLSSPKFTTIPSNKSIFEYESLNVDFDANEDVTWSIDDTENFTINSEGTLTDDILEVGNYTVIVAITDNAGNTNSTAFGVEVKESNVYLWIWDDTNDARGENREHDVGVSIGFYAELTNSTSPYNDCKFKHNNSGNWSDYYNMSFNSDSGIYEYHTSFDNVGDYYYRITCFNVSDASNYTSIDDFHVSAIDDEFGGGGGGFVENVTEEEEPEPEEEEKTIQEKISSFINGIVLYIGGLASPSKPSLGFFIVFISLLILLFVYKRYEDRINERLFNTNKKKKNRPYFRR